MKLFIFLFLSLGSTATLGQPVQLEYSGKKEKIIKAVKEANRILSSVDFYKQIEGKLGLDNSTYTGPQIANEMKNLNRAIKVVDYWNPFSKANASTVSRIRMNKAKLNRSLASVVNTLIHETVHAVDWWANQQWDYTHNGNAPGGQHNTAPWVIGAIGEEMVI
jgi:hypothetical protein